MGLHVRLSVFAVNLTIALIPLSGQAAGISWVDTSLEFVLASKTSSTFKLPAELLVKSATVGYYNSSNTRVTEKDKSY